MCLPYPSFRGLHQRYSRLVVKERRNEQLYLEQRAEHRAEHCLHFFRHFLSAVYISVFVLYVLGTGLRPIKEGRKNQ